MSLFPWLKGLQTATTLTALVLVLICGTVLLQRWRERPLPDGYLMTLSVLLMGIGSLISFGWIATQYWFYGVDHLITPPMQVRLIASFFYLTGGGLFVALTQQAMAGVGPTFALWSALVAMLVLTIALAG